MKAPPRDLSGQTVAVFGLGRSGLAAADVALQRGARVVGTDSRTREQVSSHVLALEGRGVRLWDGVEALEKDYTVEAVASPRGVVHLTFSR